MKRLFPHITRFEFVLFWSIILIQSLVWSRFLISVSLWALVFVSFFKIKHIDKEEKRHWLQWIGEYLQVWNWQLDINKDSEVIDNPLFKNNKIPLFQNNLIPFFALTIPFLLYVIGGIWSENMDYWLGRVRIRLPLLILPIVFGFLRPLSKKQLYTLLYVLIGVISINCLIVIINYAFHFKDVTDALGRGKPMPFLKQHIVFSVMAVFALLASIEIWLDNFFIKNPIEGKIIGFASIFLFIALHIISVRTGILIMYITLIIRLLAYVFQKKRYWIGAIGLVGLISIPYIAYLSIPSLQMRINYAIWDMQHFFQGDVVKKSDSERIISLQMGYEVLKQSPILGVGTGDIMDEVGKVYATHYPNLEVREPHNGLLFTAICTGLIGLVIYMTSFLIPLFYQKRYQHILFLLLIVILFLANTIDFIIEGTFGVTFTAFFLCLFLNYFKNKF